MDIKVDPGGLRHNAGAMKALRVELLAKLDNVIAALRDQVFLPPALVEGLVAELERHAALQREILACMPKREAGAWAFSEVEQYAAEACARMALEKFRLIYSDDECARGGLRAYQDKLKELPINLDPAGGAEPYSLFFSIVNEPKMALNEEQDRVLYDFFTPSLCRQLFQGAFYIPGEPTAELGKAGIAGAGLAEAQTFEETPQDGLADAAPAEPGDEQPIDGGAGLGRFTFHTEKREKFSATGFIKDHASKENGRWQYVRARAPELDLLLKFCYGKVFREKAIEGVFYGNGIDAIKPAHFNRLLKDGFITRALDTDTRKPYYALSAKGCAIFTKNTSKQLMESFAASRPLPLPVGADEMSSGSGFMRWAKLGDYNDIGLELMSIIGKDPAYEIAAEGRYIPLYFSDLSDSGMPAAVIFFEAIGVSLAVARDLSDALEVSNAWAAKPYCRNTKAGHKRLILQTGDADAAPDLDYQAAGVHGAFYFHADSENPDNNGFYDMQGGKVQPAELAGLEPMGTEPEDTGQAGKKGIDPEIIAKLPSRSRIAKIIQAHKVAEEDKARLKADGSATDETILGGDAPGGGPKKLARDLLTSGADAGDPSVAKGFRELGEALLKMPRPFENAPDALYDPVSQALMLAKALSFAPSAAELGYQADYERLLLAFGPFMEDRVSGGETISALFDEGRKATDLHLCAILRALFASDGPYRDHVLIIHTENELSKFGVAERGLLKKFMEIPAKTQNGFTDHLLAALTGERAKQEMFLSCKAMAKQCHDNPPKINARITGMPTLVEMLFGRQSELGGALSWVDGEELGNVAEIERIVGQFPKMVENGQNVFDRAEIEGVIQKAWQSAKEEHNRSHKDTATLPKIGNVPMKSLINAYIERLTILADWAGAVRGGHGAYKNLGGLKQFAAEIRGILDGYWDDLSKSDTPPSAALTVAIGYFRRKLGGADIMPITCDAISTGVFSTDQNGSPLIQREYQNVKYYEPWRNALKHIAHAGGSLKEALAFSERVSPDERREGDLPMYDNHGQAAAIRRYAGMAGEADAGDMEKARNHAEDVLEDFKNDMELAFAQGIISNEEFKEAIFNKVALFKEDFFNTGDFGRFAAFLRALRRQAADEENKRSVELHERILMARGNLRPNEEGGLLDQAEKYLGDKMFILAEDCLNGGGKGGAAELDVWRRGGGGAFQKFLNAFDELDKICVKIKENEFESAAAHLDRRMRDKKASPQYVRGAEAFVKAASYAMKARESDGPQVADLLKRLGFICEKAEYHSKVENGSRYAAKVKAEPPNRNSYDHPVGVFGTSLENNMDVIILRGNSGQKIVDIVSGLDIKNAALVIMDGVMGLPGRRAMAAKIHVDKPGMNGFLFVDRVLLLFLAEQQATDKIRLAALLACSLPFTANRFMPFIDSGDLTDEMFVGRESELREIINPTGPSIVYGGRQLGKSTLLKRARSLSNDPENRKWAFYVETNKECGEAGFIEKLKGKMEGFPIEEFSDVKGLCAALGRSYKKTWDKMLLLVDEADDLMRDFGKSGYAQLIDFNNLRVDKTKNDFKVVFAGLHDVYSLALNEESLVPNNVLVQYGEPLCIRPMARADACRLLMRPLEYWGFQLEEKQIAWLTANTNYYPGIIHNVGGLLVKNLYDSYVGYYNPSAHPPYTLETRQLRALMNSGEFNAQIAERFKRTLDVDNEYWFWTRCVVHLFYQNAGGALEGCSAREAYEFARDYLNIEVAEAACERILRELENMGILSCSKSRSGEERYFLRLSRFLGVFHSKEENEEKLLELAEK